MTRHLTIFLGDAFAKTPVAYRYSYIVFVPVHPHGLHDIVMIPKRNRWTSIGVLVLSGDTKYCPIKTLAYGP